MLLVSRPAKDKHKLKHKAQLTTNGAAGDDVIMKINDAACWISGNIGLHE